jgi:cellulose synthase/poly-beta-1,6-N-acetylglucosamine synthase-like glycosyltransferase
MKLAKFFNNAASDPSVFDDADYRPYRDAIEILASKLK